MHEPAPSPDAAPGEGRLKVIYITGSGRSGSTLLCQSLGEFNGFFCGGELSDFWHRYLGENRHCACGVEFRSCKVWSRVVREGMPSMSPSEALSIAELHRRVGRTQHLAFLLFPPLRRLVQQRLTRYISYLAILYRAIEAATQCKVIIDSSKFPSYGWILGRVPGIELFVVHLVRDPRAVAFSWTRRRPSVRTTDWPEVPRFGPVSSSLRWLARNVLAEGLWRADPQHYTFLRYEDFVADPQSAVGRILRLAGEQPSSDPFVGKDRIRLGENHIVLGNRTRFLRGVVNIQPDSEWRTRIRPASRRIVEAMTWPWMRRYRYPLRLSLSPEAGRPGEQP